ncbi:MAG: hypothetical protein KAS60_02015 [Thermoplasmata archaeon]|nr:hypothetical protein [Candidatus Thermoplasmatota archaeon]MCK4948854.1 hypothetical protein [Thermoplasmata archaeon]
MYVIFSIPKEKTGKMNEALKDDLVSRQSIAIREAKVLGEDMEGTLLLVEGTEEAVERAKEIFKEVGKPLQDDKAKSAYDKFKAEEDAVADGVGFLFG